ncbi:MAG: tyrosine-type recombinase/integrase [Dehalococcoidales bacterium]
MKTEQALREFIASRVAANLSPATISWYEDRLGPFARFCPTLPRRPEPVEAFLASIRGSQETKYDVYRALKTFYKFTAGRRRLPNPMDAIKPPRRPKTLMPTLEANELALVLRAAESPRDRALITLLIDCGGRAGETCSLLKHNIKQETVIVHGKSGWREVPISEETRHLLLQMAENSPDDHVFHGHKGPMTRHLVYEIVRRVFRKAGIKGPKLGPHRLRHAFGKNFIVAGGDLRSLQEIMGHADIQTTQKYASLNLSDIIKKHRKFSPLNAARTTEPASLPVTDGVLEQAEAILNKSKDIDALGGNGGTHQAC